ncbi:Copia protein [Symbiodinium microadriaticum]|uniref:Copia protein n=1 Tax=Symbiodinium microadriaticum TaxID=2951 RepID=A0A1Q9DVB8_SYMMI|nr:Copia protein [Symbiodinium microadriaticum]
MAYPVTYSSNLLPSLAEVNPDEPDYESLPGIALPRKAVPLPQPPAEWLEGNKTPRCPGCLGRSRFHSRKCKVRFRDYVRNTLGDLDNPEPQQQTSGKPRVQFDPQPEIVEFQEEAEYEPILPGAGEEAAPSPFDVSANPSPQEDFPLEYLPGGDVEMDQVDVEDYTVPMEMAVTPEALDGPGMLHHMYAVIPHQKHHLSPCEYDGVGLFASQLKRKTPAQHSNPDEGVVMPFGDREVWIIKPTSVVDDVSGLPLDPEKTWVGMQKEVAAMHSLGVGNVRSYQEIKAHCDDTGAKIVKSRFVFTDKVDVDQQHIVRARLVAKDFAFNQPSALDLGIASQTASVEAFKAFICRVVQDTLVLWGLDVSTAFLYAKLVLDTVLELPGCFQNLDGSKAYVILEKAIYGLRSAGLSWQKHLAGLLAELGLFPSLIEPTLYKGYWGDILVLCLVYVDDILLATRSKETNQQLLDFLTGRLKVKLTGRLEEDGRIGFLGREIIQRGRDVLLAVKKEYVESIFEAFGWNREARKKMKACTVPPDLRSVLDKEDPAKPSEELSPEAASRYRSTLGKLGWLVQTRGDLCYFHSLLSRGQSCPRAVHEECMRKVLRWLLEVPDLVQVFQKDFEAVHGTEEHKWRLQPIVALSSAESELFAMVEMARELIGLGQLISHVFDHVTSPLDLATDSASARQVSMMSGFLRRMRHVDLRLCFLQDKVENGEILVQHVPGTDNVADLQTKNLSATQTWYHIVQLGLEERLTRSTFLSGDSLPASCILFVCMKGLFSASADDPWTLLVGRCKLQTPHHIVMVEFCTSGEAWLTKLANHYGIHAIPVVVEVDATLPETMELIEASLQLASRKNMHVIVWASTPCTGGSPWQQFHRARDEQYYDNKMKGLFTVHRKLWKGFLKLVNTSASTTWVIEWPQRCAYWGWASTKSFLKQNEHGSTLVFGCACGMVGNDGLPIKKDSACFTLAQDSDGSNGVVMAARVVLHQVLHGEQRKAARSSVQSHRRISASGLALSLEVGQEEEGFLQTLKWSIEARVPGVHGPPAGTGGTGNAGEEDSDSQDGDARAKEGAYACAAETASMRSFETGLSDQERLEEYPKRQCRIISPKNPWKICWDVFVGILIIYTIIAMTWRIGFDQAAQGGALIFDYAVDAVFAVDTVLCFRTGFYAESAEDTLITDAWEIAKRYCMSYFLFDLLSWLPIDLLVQVITGHSGAEMKSVKLMKFVRLIRLAKLMRLFKLGRFLAILEEQLHLKPAMIRMVRLILNIVFLAHLLACMWHFIALPACGESEDMSSIGPCSDRIDDVYISPNWIRHSSKSLQDLDHRGFGELMAFLDSEWHSDGGPAAQLRASLKALLQELGAKREEARAKDNEEAAEEAGRRMAEEPDRLTGFSSFTADLVLKEDASGFELWIGSLEDALNLRALRDRGIDAVLNCAVRDCEAEIACFKPHRCQRRARAHTRNASMGMEAKLGASWLGLRRDQIWSLASFDADWYSDVLELDVVYEGLPAKDEVGYDMRGHCQETSFEEGQDVRGMSGQGLGPAHGILWRPRGSPVKFSGASASSASSASASAASTPQPAKPAATRRLLALLAVQVLRPGSCKARQRRCACVECSESRLSCEESISAVSSNGLRFLFFTEQNLSCQELQRRAEDLVAKSVGRFRAYALTSRIFAGRIGEPPVPDCRWEPGEWFAAVVEEATGRPVSFYHGAAEQAERRTSIIKYLEATLVEPVQGATSWGFRQTQWRELRKRPMLLLLVLQLLMWVIASRQGTRHLQEAPICYSSSSSPSLSEDGSSQAGISESSSFSLVLRGEALDQARAEASALYRRELDETDGGRSAKSRAGKHSWFQRREAIIACRGWAALSAAPPPLHLGGPGTSEQRDSNTRAYVCVLPSLAAADLLLCLAPCRPSKLIQQEQLHTVRPIPSIRMDSDFVRGSITAQRIKDSPCTASTHYQAVVQMLPMAYRASQPQAEFRFEAAALQSAVSQHSDAAQALQQAVETRLSALPPGAALCTEHDTVNAILLDETCRAFPPAQRADHRVSAHQGYRASARGTWQLHHQLRRSGLPSLRNLWEKWRLYVQFMRASAMLRRQSKDLKRQFLEDQMRQAEAAARKGNHRDLFLIARRLGPKTAQGVSRLQGSDGRVLDSSAEMAAILKHSQATFAATPDNTDLQPLQAGFTFSAEELHAALDALNIRKAVPRHIAPNAVWKLCAASVGAHLGPCFEHHFRPKSTDLLEGDLQDAHICWLNKPSKPPTTMSAKGPIGLMPPCAKSLAGSVASQILEHLQPMLDHMPQFAYCAGRGVNDAILRVHSYFGEIETLQRGQINNRFKMHQGVKALHCHGGLCLSLDLSSAFDSVSRDLLIQSLLDHQVPSDLINVVQQLHRGAKYIFRTSQARGQVTTTNGIKQGCRAAPPLWVSFTLSVLEHLARHRSLSWVQSILTLFADDFCGHWTITCLQDWKAAISDLTLLMETLETYQLKVNLQKTALLVNLKGKTAKKLLRQHTRQKAGETFLILQIHGRELIHSAIKHPEQQPPEEPAIVDATARAYAGAETPELAAQNAVPLISDPLLPQMGDHEADIFAHCMPSGAVETGTEQAPKRARPDLQKQPGRQGGRSHYPSPSQLPWRPTPASFSAQPAQDSQLRLISKLLLKHEEQLAALRKDTQFVLFFRQDDKSILPSLMSVSREWKAKQAAGDQSIQSSQRTVLINCLLKELLARVQRVVATEPGRDSLKKAEWLTSSNAWTYMRWSSKLRKLVADETKEPLVHDEAVRTITELQKSMRGEIIHKFQSTINLAKLEEQGAQQAIFHLAVSLRGSEATEVYDQFRKLAGLSLTNLAGFSMKVDDQLRPPMAQQLAQLTYGGGHYNVLSLGDVVHHVLDDAKPKEPATDAFLENKLKQALIAMSDDKGMNHFLLRKYGDTWTAAHLSLMEYQLKELEAQMMLMQRHVDNIHSQMHTLQLLVHRHAYLYSNRVTNKARTDKVRILDAMD